MKVPVYEQQQQLKPLPVNQLNAHATPDAFGASVASGMGALANAALKIREMQDQNASWEMSNDLAVRKSELDRLRVDLNLQNREGKIDSVQMAQLWDEGSKGILERETAFTSGNPESFAKYQAAKNLIGEEYKTSMMPDLYKASVTDRSITFTKALNNFEKQISELPPEQAKIAIDAFLNSEKTREFAFPIYEANWEKEKINLINGIAKRNAFYLADKVNNIEQIQRYRGMVENNEGSFGDVTADGKIDLLNYFDKKEAQLLEAERRERESLNKEAENWLIDYEKNIFSGGLLDPAYVDIGRQLTKGTQFESDFNFLRTVEGAVPAFNNLHITAQGQQISEVRNRLRNTPSATASDDRRRFEFFERLYEDNKKMYENNRMEYNAMRANIQLKNISNMNILTGDASQFAGVMRDKFYLSEGTEVFTEHEINDYKNKSPSWTDDQHVKAFGNIAATFQNEQNGYKIAMEQLSSGDNALLGAGLVYQAKAIIDKDTGATSEVVAKQIMEGNRLIKNKQITLPDNKDFESAFNSTYASVYNSPIMGKSMQAHFESAKALYASWSATQGKQETDIDGKLFAKAMRYTGGEPMKINGSSIAVPLGMDADDVKNRIVYTLNMYAQNGVIPEKYKNDFGSHTLNSQYSVTQADNGKYVLTYRGNTVPSSNGGLVVVDIYKPAKTPNPGFLGVRDKLKGINKQETTTKNTMIKTRFGL